MYTVSEHSTVSPFLDSEILLVICKLGRKWLLTNSSANVDVDTRVHPLKLESFVDPTQPIFYGSNRLELSLIMMASHKFNFFFLQSSALL